MKKRYILYTILGILLTLITSLLEGFSASVALRNFVHFGLAIFIIVFFNHYITKKEELERQFLYEKEKENIKNGVVSDFNPLKSALIPMIENLKRLREIDKRLRDYSSSVFHKQVVLSELNEKENDIVTKIGEKIEQININLRSFTEKIEILSASTEESSSSTLELGASIEEVSENVSKLFNYVDETSTAIFELIAISKQLNQTLESLKKITEDTNSAMLEMEASVKEVESRALESAKFTESMERDAQLGKEAITATEESMKKIKESNSYSYQALSELSTDIKSIGKILKVIEEISEETALLALNAAIIASQSGEQGKAFGVVAEEIKELAERTGLSTKEISNIIQNILAKSDKASNAINQSTKAIEEGVELTVQTGEIFKKILNSIENADEIFREIAKANVEQSKGITHIAKSMENINSMVSDFSRAMTEQRKGAEQIILATERVKDIATFVKNSTQEQARTSKQLGKLVVEVSDMSKFFKDQIFKFRNSFDDMTKNILELRPINKEIFNIVVDLDVILKTIEKELQNLTEIRKSINGRTS